MKRALIDFWYGNITPQDHKQNDPRVKDLSELMERNRSDLSRTLNDSQREILEKYDECVSEISGFSERDIFVYAFSLGMRLAMEALSDENIFDVL